MDEPLRLLLVQFLEWVARAPRSHAETLDAWRTHCPRLTVWEEAQERGLVRLTEQAGLIVVAITPSGHAMLGQRGTLPDQVS